MKAYTKSSIRTMVTYWESVVMLMDDKLREQVHAELAPCSEEDFAKRYCELHFEKYGVPFVF